MATETKREIIERKFPSFKITHAIDDLNLDAPELAGYLKAVLIIIGIEHRDMCDEIANLIRDHV